MCAATRVVRPVGDMIRFVVAPDGAVVPDLDKSYRAGASGLRRPDAPCSRRSSARHSVAGLKRDVRVDPALVALTEQLLERAALDALAICGKASDWSASGFAKVEAALARGPVVALCCMPPMRRGMASKSLMPHCGGILTGCQRTRIVDDLSADQLDLALGRPNVVHAALLTGSPRATPFSYVMRVWWDFALEIRQSSP